MIRKQNIVTIILALILFAGTFVLAYGYLRPGHNVIGDFALYLRQIQALWQGDAKQVYEDMVFMLSNSSNDVYSPTLYPWGFPLIMSPFYPLFGLNHLAYKIVIAVLFSGAVAMIFFTFRRKENFYWQAALIAALIAIQPKYLSWTSMILSEMPYLLFVMLSMLAINKIYTDKEISRTHVLQYAVLGVLLMFTAQIRTEGILLFPALAMQHLYYLFQNRKQWLSWKKAPRFFLILSIPYLSGLAFFILLSLILPSGFMKHTDHFEYTSAIHVLVNVIGYFRSLQQFSPLSTQWAALFFIFVMLWGIIERFPKDIAESSFLLISIGFLFIWPHQNTRHLFALLPFGVYFFARGLASIPFRVFKVQWSVYALLAIFLIVLPGTLRSAVNNYQAANRTQPYGTESPASQEMYEYIRTNTSPNDVIGYAHARTIYFYTGRRCISIWGATDLLWRPVDWYVWGIHGGQFMQYTKEALEEYGNEIKEVFRNNDYVVYKIKKDDN